jgi:hypothetical protein
MTHAMVLGCSTLEPCTLRTLGYHVSSQNFFYRKVESTREILKMYEDHEIPVESVTYSNQTAKEEKNDHGGYKDFAHSAASWEDLYKQPLQLLNNSMCGISLCGGDVLGFYGDPSRDGKWRKLMISSWYMMSVFTPLFRADSHKDCIMREPWELSAELGGQVSQSIRLRYQLIPYIWCQLQKWNC